MNSYGIDSLNALVAINLSSNGRDCNISQENIFLLKNKLTNDNDNLASSISILSHVFFDPNNDLIQKKLDWLGVILSSRSKFAADVTLSVLNAYNNIMRIVSSNCVSYDSIALKVKFIINVVMLERDFQFICEISELYEFLLSIEVVLSQCILSAIDSGTNISGYKNLILCGELFKCFAQSLKTRKSTLSSIIFNIDNTTEHEKWLNLLYKFFDNCLSVLVLPMLPKDVVSCCGMVLAALLWYINKLQAFNCSLLSFTTNTSYLSQIIFSLLTTQIDTPNNASHTDINTSHSINASHTSINDMFSFSIIRLTQCPSDVLLGPCTMIRGLLGIFDDNRSLFGAVTSSVVDKTSNPLFELSTTTNPTLNLTSLDTVLMFGPMYKIIYDTWAHPLPEIKQYGLQTLEIWLDKIYSMITCTPPTSTSTLAEGCDRSIFELLSLDVKFAEEWMNLLGKIAHMLITSWTHPTKQVCNFESILN